MLEFEPSLVLQCDYHTNGLQLCGEASCILGTHLAIGITCSPKSNGRRMCIANCLSCIRNIVHEPPKAFSLHMFC